MNRVNVKTLYLITDDGVVYLDSIGYDYSGPWELVKKGDSQKRVAGEQEAYGKKEEGVQDTARTAGDAIAQQETATAPGQMSPYAAADYASETEKIANTYQNLRQAGFRALGARGFGNAPAGFTSSMTNNLLDQQGRAQTSAYRAGLDKTQADRDKAQAYYSHEQDAYNPNATRAGATQSYTAGDNAVAQSWKTGIGAATGIASMFVPGVGALAGLSKLGSGAPKSYGQPTYSDASQPV